MNIRIFFILIFTILAFFIFFIFFNNPKDPNNKEGGTKVENQSTSQQEKDLLLPDLRISKLNQAYIVNLNSKEKIMRFETTIQNIGKGPLEIIGKKENNSITAIQKIYKKDNKTKDKKAGNFIFHSKHNHWHFEKFVEFKIYNINSNNNPGEKIASTDKMTFCLFDTNKLSGNFQNKPQNPKYPECNPKIQGISPGWSDTYSASVPGQEININIPDGIYIFQAIVDPENRIKERNEKNNTTNNYIEIKNNSLKILKNINK